tara:strand:- start:2609 stop:2995 length:387 start_codon:yes stop_codon:yes gene_type:complete
MPKVGDKEYTYDAEGQAAAKKESMKTGEPVIQTYDAGGRVKKIQGITTDAASPQYMSGYAEGGKVKYPEGMDIGEGFDPLDLSDTQYDPKGTKAGVQRRMKGMSHSPDDWEKMNKEIKKSKKKRISNG